MRSKAIFAFLALPVLVAGIVPILIIYFDRFRTSISWPGIVLSVAGVSVLLRCVYDFYKTGHGTLAHWNPPKKLVTVGLYRYTRSPMYLGALSTVGGLAWLFGSPMLLVYLATLAIIFHLHVVYREEPWLAENFGDEWHNYAARVSRWLPRKPRSST